VTVAEIEQLTKLLGEDYTTEQLEQLLAKADLDKD